jgi:CDP-glucose 4,6-dehydratase
MKAGFWKGKRVLVTGHTGFKGSWLVVWLRCLGAEVIGYSLAPPTQPSLFKDAQVADGIISIHGDVCDLPGLKAAIFEHAPEIVIHMAAQSLVRLSYKDPVETFTTNVMGTVNVLEAVRCVPEIRVLLNVTTDKCYENKEWLWGYREHDPLGGHDPYSSSKGCAELVTSAYRRSFFEADADAWGTSVATVRAGNVIGGGDWATDRLVPDIMRAIMAKRPVLIRNPAAIRPWQHVLEPLNGYLTLIEHMWENGHIYTGSWNFGPHDGDAKPVSWVVGRLTECWGDGARWELDQSDNPHEAYYLKLDCTKSKCLLTWMPQLNLSLALEWVAEWFKGYESGAGARCITENQIARFMDLATE